MAGLLRMCWWRGKTTLGPHDRGETCMDHVPEIRCLVVLKGVTSRLKGAVDRELGGEYIRIFSQFSIFDVFPKFWVGNGLMEGREGF